MTEGFSRTLDRALVLAALVHEGTPRKGTVVPYIIHPVEVMVLLLRHGYGEPLLTAALLHDVVEDIDYADGRLQLAVRSAFPRAGLPDRIQPANAYRETFRDFLEHEFEAPVVSLVRGMTEPKNDGKAPRSWTERKRLVVEHLDTASLDLVALKAADVLHNVRSIVEDVAHHGAAVLDRFNAGPGESLAYYRKVSEIAVRRLGPVPLADELHRATADLARLVESTCR